MPLRKLSHGRELANQREEEFTIAGLCLRVIRMFSTLVVSFVAVVVMFFVKVDNIHEDASIYYIKVIGVPIGNKLIKTIWYPHMWRYRWFHWYQVVFKFVSVSSKHLRVFLNLRKSSDIFGNSRKMFKSVRLAFGTILEMIFGKVVENQKVVENLQIIKNAVISTFI